jgi:hypothetical protein
MPSRRTLAAYLPVIVAMVVLSVIAPFALAAKGGNANGGGGGGGGGGKNGGSTTGGGSGGSTTGSGGSTSGGTLTTTLALSSESLSTNPNLPSSCLSEDAFDQRVFTGSLNGSYSTSYQLCGLNTDGLTAGGLGITGTVSVVGQLSDMTITAPDGTAHHAVVMSQSTYKGVVTTTYAVCWCPPYYLATDTGTAPLQGGTWTVTLSGQITSATWTTTTNMANVTWQQAYCPTSQQNLL